MTKCASVSSRWRTWCWTSSQPTTTAHPTFQCYQHAEEQQLPGNSRDAATEGGGGQTPGCKGNMYTIQYNALTFKVDYAVKETWMENKRLFHLS